MPREQRRGARPACQRAPRPQAASRRREPCTRRRPRAPPPPPPHHPRPRTPASRPPAPRYIEYECKLEELRKHRRKALELADSKKTLADYAIVRRVHFIFERATRKFRSDLSLWTRWLEFCRDSSSSKQLSKVATKAVQVHPTAAGLWVYAAAW